MKGITFSEVKFMGMLIRVGRDNEREGHWELWTN